MGGTVINSAAGGRIGPMCANLECPLTGRACDRSQCAWWDAGAKNCRVACALAAVQALDREGITTYSMD